MKVVVGADHAGYTLKEFLVAELEKVGHTVLDVGAHAYDKADDYPDFSAAVGRSVAAGEGERGVLVCGSGLEPALPPTRLKAPGPAYAMIYIRPFKVSNMMI